MNEKPTQEKLFDQWTIPHAFTGAVCSFLGFDWKAALVLAVAWEAFENNAHDPAEEGNASDFLVAFYSHLYLIQSS